LFTPDYRNAHHQFYCGKAACRQASKAASQRRWLRHPANRNYFRDPDNARRVRLWRQAHPGYWRQKSAPPPDAQVAAPPALNPGSPLVTQSPPGGGALQDVCPTLPPVFIGLISMLTGSALQEDIALTTRKLETKGRDILGLTAPVNARTVYDYQTSHST
jgi:hypothetical protein